VLRFENDPQNYCFAKNHIPVAFGHCPEKQGLATIGNGLLLEVGSTRKANLLVFVEVRLSSVLPIMKNASSPLSQLL